MRSDFMKSSWDAPLVLKGPFQLREDAMNKIHIFSILTLIATSLHAQPVEFKGEFETVEATSMECEALYAPTEYNAKFFLMGPTNRTAVLNLSRADKTGFFHQLTLVGRLGGSGDVEVTKSFTKDGLKYDLIASGIVSYQVLLVNIQTTVTKAETKETICTGNSDFSAFN